MSPGSVNNDTHEHNIMTENIIKNCMKSPDDNNGWEYTDDNGNND